jgi:hypothetical protein
MEKHFSEETAGLCFHQTPKEVSEENLRSKKKVIENELCGYAFPCEYRKYFAPGN